MSNKRILLVDENDVVIDSLTVGGVHALAVDIAGSAGSAATLSIANKIETSTIESATGWNTVLNLTVPTGKTWYLKGMTVSAESFAKFRMKINTIQKFYSRSDADDINEVTLFGYQVDAGGVILIEGDAGAVGKELVVNLIIYEV